MKLRKLGGLAAIPAGLMVSGLLVVGASSAAFTAQAPTGDNTWSTGHIALSHDAAEQAVFDAHNILPGDSGTANIQVEFEGTVQSDIRLFAEEAVDASPLADSLQLTISENGSELFSGSLHEFGTRDSFVEGLSTWNTSVNDLRTFTIDWELPDSATSSDLMGQSASVVFVWEAQTARS